MAHVGESVHWYRRDGTACYEVPRADGKGTRPPTLADARKLGLVPGFSAVSRVLAAPGLEKWKRDQAVLAALTLTRLPDESDAAFLARVDTDGKAHAKQRADEGTEIHKAIEQFLRGETYDTRWHTHVSKTVELLNDLHPGRKWVCEKTFACKAGYGGRSDALADDNSVLVDFKTKLFGPEKSNRELFYDDHVRQLVAYMDGMFGVMDEKSVMRPRLVSIIISASVPGLVRHLEWEDQDVEKARKEFGHMLALWQSVNDYDSSWE